MILLFFKSIIIGVANIIPGVSGGTLAVMLNVYDPITEKIGNFFLVDRKTKLSYFFYLLVVLVGAATGIFLYFYYRKHIKLFLKSMNLEKMFVSIELYTNVSIKSHSHKLVNMSIFRAGALLLWDSIILIE